MNEFFTKSIDYKIYKIITDKPNDHKLHSAPETVYKKLCTLQHTNSKKYTVTFYCIVTVWGGITDDKELAPEHSPFQTGRFRTGTALGDVMMLWMIAAPVNSSYNNNNNNNNNNCWVSQLWSQKEGEGERERNYQRNAVKRFDVCLVANQRAVRPPWLCKWLLRCVFTLMNI